MINSQLSDYLCIHNTIHDTVGILFHLNKFHWGKILHIPCLEDDTDKENCMTNNPKQFLRRINNKMDDTRCISLYRCL